MGPNLPLPSEALRTYVLLLITKEETLMIIQYYLVREELVNFISLVLICGN